MSAKRKIQLFISLCLIIIPGISQAWWSNDWQYRKKITLDTSAATGIDVKGNAADVPVLIRLHSGNFSYFLDLKQDGGDLRFIDADDKTPLKYTIEKFDPINEMALIWVNVPRVNGASNTNSIWMYYGNQSAPNGEDTAGTYDAPQSLVLHFNDKDKIPHDVTAYKNNPTQSTAEYFDSSIIGSGVQFKKGSLIKLPVSPSLDIDPQKGWTFSAWVKMSAPENNAYLLQQLDGRNKFAIMLDRDSVVVEGNHFKTQKISSLTVDSWHHLSVVIGSGQVVVYVDGIEQGKKALSSFAPIAGTAVIGSEVNGGHAFNGAMDEVKLANTARSADYIALEAKAEAAQSKLVTLGADEQKESSSGGGASYFGIILQNVTLDGWVVIGVLLVMAVISWIVMVGKGFIIRQAQRDNSAFIDSFKTQVNSDPASLDQHRTEDEKELATSPLAEAVFGKHDHFQSSPLYHIYHAGIREVNARLGRAVGAQASGLSLQAIESIRATLDASLVRESQRLNKQMVLLTIAISGGPFLGLLGTVVGVMITFAAIAAAGDVNVNAIAPGIAAALVATVAGLGVAIPALFGYNYISSRIKEINADMHVFVDEFLTRVAEHYGQA